MAEAEGEKLVTSICISLTVYLSTKGPAAMETRFQSLLHSRLHMEGDRERKGESKEETKSQYTPPQSYPFKTQTLSTHLFCVTLRRTGRQAALALAHAICNHLSSSWHH